MIVVAMATAMLTSCRKGNAPADGFCATIEKTGGNAKTHINPDWANDNSTILWSSYDLIKVANNSGQTGCQTLTFGLAEGENTASGTFYTNEEHEDFFESDYVALYPAYNADESENTISGTTATFHIPATQVYKENSFGEKSMPMVAYSETQSLSFKNLFGGLCVPLTGDNVTVKRLVLTSHVATDNLCGTFTADCNGNANDNYGLTCTNETPCPSVTLDCGEGVLLTANDSVFFCIMVPPGAMNGTGESAGFSIAVYDPEDALVCTLSTTVNPLITRNNISLAGTKQNVVSDSHAYVDLGLPSGLLWATCNIGADTPEAYGDYFAWGETTTKDTYTEGYYTYSGNPDVLPSDYDAATANWGDNWRMPTKAEFEELLNNTTNSWKTQNGVKGRLFTATNGNSIFLPAAGYRWGWGSDLINAGSYGYYWSRSLRTGNQYNAWYLYFNSDDCEVYDYYRGSGLSVRPVRSARQN
jgi:uncharacterized protein (TIGR02145 family)